MIGKKHLSCSTKLQWKKDLFSHGLPVSGFPFFIVELTGDWNLVTGNGNATFYFLPCL